MDSGQATFNRWFVGIAACACFTTSVVIVLRDPNNQFWWGSFLRAGVVLVALWFCLPSRDRPAAWSGLWSASTLILLGAGVLTVLRPKIGLPVLLIVLGVRAFSNVVRRRRSSPRP